ncbi:sialate O-acetylesterase [Mangrovibacterium lignilyticum]|uniref:sialate O-acetylesterase n=1 Tax=Mangrovibacterium lignilyticum TaxID=2668052 RepID=UPI0013D10BE2|nr:sialate O-acetylesterase [Mangrovibacterium lignilyticum]
MKKLVILLGVLLSFLAVKAEVKLARIFSSNMVLQKGLENPVWGRADKNEKITVLFAGAVIETKASRNGNWSVKLPPMDYGGPYTLIVEGSNTLRLTNIQIGEVWVCSGQSNMEFTVDRAINAEKEIAEANYPKIRMFTVPQKVATEPQSDLDRGTWEVCSPETVPHFSAVGYFFARSLFQDLDVPIGVIHTSWGGTVAETWMSLEMMKKEPDFKDLLSELKKFDMSNFEEMRRKQMEEVLGSPLTQKDNGLVDGKAIFAAVDFDDSSWNTIQAPELWEGQGYANIDGIAWYRKTIELTKEQASAKGSISLAQIDDNDQTWINGVLVGGTNQYDAHRVYQIPADVLKEGRNTIAIRVVDTGGGGGIFGNEGEMFLLLGDEKVDLSGAWKFKISEVSTSATTLGPNDYPTLLYNGMLNPIIPYGIKGAIWYQGESNADRAFQYRKLFKDLITDWRSQWDLGEFPFCWVQLANFMAADEQPSESAWAELRESQAMALELPKTGQALAIDIGEAGDIHPTNKQDVGKRLALNALKIAYEKDVVNSGPMYESMEVKGNKVYLHFKETGSGLQVKDKYGYVNAFAVAGDDQQFHWAKGELVDQTTVVVSSADVEKPVAVRFAWGNNPDDLNLYNKEGLPAVPFRTDNWKGVTE